MITDIKHVEAVLYQIQNSSFERARWDFILSAAGTYSSTLLTRALMSKTDTVKQVNEKIDKFNGSKLSKYGTLVYGASNNSVVWFPNQREFEIIVNKKN